MEFTGVYHKTSEQMSYPLDEDRLIVNIKTGYDVKQVFINYGDPYEAGILGGKEKWTGKREEIIYKKRLPHQIWWTTTLFPEYKRCKYYFELRTEQEVWYYFEDGFLTEEQLQMDGRMQQCFIVPWMNPADINRTPAWVNDTIWYQIFPDRFCNGTPEKNGNDITPWRNHGTVTNKEKFGGNLEGIRQRLPYLQELGITGIYLNPIMEAESNHKYDTTDYTKIDPAFGDEETMKALCREAHEKGIRIMVDAVFNHCGRKFAPWVDVLEHGKDSRYADWFMIEDWEQIGKRADTRDRRFYAMRTLISWKRRLSSTRMTLKHQRLSMTSHLSLIYICIMNEYAERGLPDSFLRIVFNVEQKEDRIFHLQDYFSEDDHLYRYTGRGWIPGSQRSMNPACKQLPHCW